jgi:hypothetical protein
MFGLIHGQFGHNGLDYQCSSQILSNFLKFTQSKEDVQYWDHASQLAWPTREICLSETAKALVVETE